MTPPIPIPRTGFSTDGMSGHEGWEAWRGVIAPLFDIDREGGMDSFCAAIEAFDLRTTLLAKITLGGVRQTGRRSKQLIRRSGIDHYAIELCLSSEGHFCEGRNGTCELRAGSIVVLDLGQVNTSATTNSASITLNMPRAMLDRHCPDIERLHGSCIGEPGLSRLLGDHMVSLASQLPHLTMDQADTVAEATAAMIGACFAPSRERLGRAGGVIDRTLLDRAKQYIESRLSDPTLAAASICSAVGTSRSNLYRLFQPLGGVAHHIQERRLRRVHTALRNPAEWRSISELAYTYGFVNVSHFSRVFRDLFGCPPSDVRDLARARAAPAPKTAASKNFIGAWLRDLQLY